MPERIQRKRRKGWRMPAGAVYVGRPTQWANPFIVGKPILKVWLHMELDLADTKKYLGEAVVADRAEAVRLFRKYCSPDVAALEGKDIACWCPLDEPCHADVLLEWANSRGGEDANP